jgi:glucose uptake protein GlcU
VEKGGSFSGAVKALPPWHFKELWFPGMMSGILFSIGEFASIIAVSYLGQGVGNTFVQCKILVAGLWGLLYYK